MKIEKVIYYTIFAIIAVLAVGLFATAFPIPGNFQVKIVQSGSMEPAIKTGSIVVIKPSDTYKIGDVITFMGEFKDSKGNRIPITHRIVDMAVNAGNPMYVTKGDANDDADSRQLPQRAIVGKVLFSIPYIGYGIAATKTKYGLFAIIIIPATVVIWDQTTRIMKEFKSLKKEEEKKEKV